LNDSDCRKPPSANAVLGRRWFAFIKNITSKVIRVTARVLDTFYNSGVLRNWPSPYWQAFVIGKVSEV